MHACKVAGKGLHSPRRDITSSNEQAPSVRIVVAVRACCITVHDGHRDVFGSAGSAGATGGGAEGVCCCDAASPETCSCRLTRCSHPFPLRHRVSCSCHSAPKGPHSHRMTRECGRISAFALAETLVTPPRQSLINIVQRNVFWIKVSKTY